MPTTPHPRSGPALPAIALLTLVAACTSGSAAASSTSTVVTTSPSPSTQTTVVSTECSQGPATPPAGSASGQIVDLDGDGRPDTLWVSTAASGEVRVGVITSSGQTAIRNWDSASPVMRSVMAIDVNPETPPLLLADDGRLVDVWDFSDCGLVDVTNNEGAPYVFSLGFGPIGTGVGCEMVDGRQELVGYDITSRAANSVDWTATVVGVEGTGARNGTTVSGTYSSPADDAAIARLSSVSCGTQTIEADGIGTRTG